MVQIENLWKSYTLGETKLEILKGAVMRVERGQFVSVSGASGTGKSTLLHVLGGLDTPDEGSVLVDGESVFDGDEREIAQRRNRRIGFVFQFHHLLPEFSALENVALSQRIGGVGEREALAHASQRLTEVGLAERLEHLPNQLSGGERQRVAVARSLVNDPDLLLMDEPTGNLDPKTGDLLFNLLAELQKNLNLTIIMVTHNQELASRTDRRYLLRDGKLSNLD